MPTLAPVCQAPNRSQSSTPARLAPLPRFDAPSAPVGDTWESRNWTKVREGLDLLRVKVTPGMTLWSLAVAYATDLKGDNQFGKIDPADLKPFVEKIKKVNGLTSDTLRVGQTIGIPTDLEGTNFKLALAIAIQKSEDDRKAAGHRTYDLDFGRIQVEEAPLESYKVTMPDRRTGERIAFRLLDDASGEHDDAYRVYRESELPALFR